MYPVIHGAPFLVHYRQVATFRLNQLVAPVEMRPQRQQSQLRKYSDTASIIRLNDKQKSGLLLFRRRIWFAYECHHDLPKISDHLPKNKKGYNPKRVTFRF